MVEGTAGYREREHTADWELEVWAPDLAGLLVQAALGMYALSGMEVGAGQESTRSIRLSATDAEGLLVTFLEELLYYAEMDGLAFHTFELSLDGTDLEGTMLGAELSSQTKEIKAVTYHNLHIRETGPGLEASIVFDV